MSTPTEVAEANLASAKRALSRAQASVDRSQAVLDALSSSPGTSEEVAALAAKGLGNPKSLTASEVRAVCASALAQKAEGQPDNKGPEDA